MHFKSFLSCYRKEEKHCLLIKGILVITKKPRSNLDLFVWGDSEDEGNEKDEIGLFIQGALESEVGLLVYLSCASAPFFIQPFSREPP